jgi:hypothetical protein
MKNAAGLLLALLVLLIAGCNEQPATTVSAAPTQVKEFVGTVTVDPNTGATVEQKNIQKRLSVDNEPGAVKHLYVVSAYSGQVIFYSTVDGKVTSSGKRLQPYEKVDTVSGGSYGALNPYSYENLQDDGTYGSSIDYLYWWDAQGRYHQHYPSGGQIIHISDQPLTVKGITINLSSEGE